MCLIPTCVCLEQVEVTVAELIDVIPDFTNPRLDFALANFVSAASADVHLEAM